MFTIGLIIILLICLLIFLVGNTLGNKRIKQQEQELEIMRQKQLIEKQQLQQQLSHKKEIQSIAQQMIKDKEIYMINMKDEIEQLESELEQLQQNQIPTREQLETWLFLLKAENRLSNNTANQILKLYDIKGIYPKSEV